MTKRSTLSTILFMGLVMTTGCVGEAPGGGGPGSTPGDNNDDPNDPGDPNDPTDPNDPPGGGATASQVIELISKTECDQAHACKASFPTNAGVTFAEIFGNSTAECYPLNAEYWNAPAVEAGITAGKITFDQAAADECMAGMISAPVCTAFWNEGPGIPEACWAVFTGTVAQGGACTTDFECSGELACGQAGTCAADTGQ